MQSKLLKAFKAFKDTFASVAEGTENVGILKLIVWDDF